MVYFLAGICVLLRPQDSGLECDAKRLSFLLGGVPGRCSILVDAAQSRLVRLAGRLERHHQIDHE